MRNPEVNEQSGDDSSGSSPSVSTLAMDERVYKEVPLQATMLFLSLNN